MKKIGLALGGGAILGAAHIGVLRVLEERKIQIGCITGTSIGAFIAALYAFGVSSHEIEEKVADLNWLDAAGFSFSKYGLLSNEKLGNTLTKTLGDVNFEDAEIPVAVVATDIGACRKVVLNEGSVAEAVMASSCVPGIFIPVEIGDKLLVDGGLVENVPISPLKKMGANMIIGVDINANRKYRKPEDLIDVLANALDLAIDNATRIQTDEADILIAPELSAYNRTGVKKVHDLVRKGYNTASAVLNEIDIMRRDHMGAKEDAYVQKMKARLDEWNAEIEKLTAEAEHAGGQTKIECEKKLAELQRKKEELEDKIVAVEGGRQSSWKDFKEGVDNSWKIFKKTLSRTKSEFEHGYKEGKK